MFGSEFFPASRRYEVAEEGSKKKPHRHSNLSLLAVHMVL